MCVLWCLLEYLSFTRRHHKACRVIIRKALQEVVSSQQCMAHFLRPPITSDSLVPCQQHFSTERFLHGFVEPFDLLPAI